jgi:hypothetical protein
MHTSLNGEFSNGQSSHWPAFVLPILIGIGQRLFRVLLVSLFFNLQVPMFAGAASTDEQIAAIKAQMNDAIFKVQDIVNQPVTQLKRTPGMIVGYYPFWFHPGAIKPDFNKVDVRTTQKFDYDKFQYITSDSNPGVVFRGPDVEFNPMTKYFYTDRLVPKKKLTEAEMLEINRLYRIIGHCEQQLNESQNPEPTSQESDSPLENIQRLVTTHKPVVVGSMTALVVILLLVRKMQLWQAED